MKINRLKMSAKLALVLPAAGILMAAFAPAAQAEPMSNLSNATNLDMVQPWYPWDFLWVEASNPHGHEKLLITFTANNVPTPQIATNVTNDKGEFFNTSDWILDPFVETNQPSVKNSRLDFSFQGNDTWHLIFNDAVSQVGVPGAVADLWFTESKPGAKYDTSWDAPERVFWSSSIGTGRVDGWIQFPNTPYRTEVVEWAPEEERMAGPFSLFPRHKGYDYAQSGNPDGSADQLFIYNNIDGTKRGLLAHTSREGVVTKCEPTDIQLGNWKLITDAMDRGVRVEAFVYPQAVSAQCDYDGGTLRYDYISTEEHLFPVKVGPSNWVVGASTMNSGYEKHHPGSIATIQHYRNPPWAGSQTDWRIIPS